MIVQTSDRTAAKLHWQSKAGSCTSSVAPASDHHCSKTIWQTQSTLSRAKCPAGLTSYIIKVN